MLRRPMTGQPSTGAMWWGLAAAAVPGTITAGQQAWTGYYAKAGRAAEMQGHAALAQAKANQTTASAELIMAKAFAEGKGGGLNTTTMLLIGGGILAAAFILMRRR